MQPLSKAKLKLFSSLHLKKYREEAGLYIIEGRKMLAEAIMEGIKPEAVLLCNLPGGIQIPGVDKARMYSVTEAELSKLSGQANPEGVIAILPYPGEEKINFVSQADPLPQVTDEPGFILHDIRDPGNLGTLIRISDWFGFPRIYCSAETADSLNPKVLRSSMGSIFRIGITYIENFSDFLSANSNRIWVADMNGRDAGKIGSSERNLVLLGNEALGIPQSIKEIVGLDFITIPGKGKAESLNAAVAGGILAWVISRGS